MSDSFVLSTVMQCENNSGTSEIVFALKKSYTDYIRLKSSSEVKTVKKVKAGEKRYKAYL